MSALPPRSCRGLLPLPPWKLAVVVARELALLGPLLPARYRRVGPLVRDKDADLYAVVGLHWLLRAASWWRVHRWDAERWLLERGFMDLEGEGGLLRDARLVDVPALPADRTRDGLVRLRWQRRVEARRRRLHRQAAEHASLQATRLVGRCRIQLTPEALAEAERLCEPEPHAFRDLCDELIARMGAEAVRVVAERHLGDGSGIVTRIGGER